MEIKLNEVLNRLMDNMGENPITLSRKTSIPITTLRNWSEGMKPSGKNLHYIHTLSEFFGVTISELLFNKKEIKKEDEILFTTTFVDMDRKYKLTVERMRK